MSRFHSAAPAGATDQPPIDVRVLRLHGPAAGGAFTSASLAASPVLIASADPTVEADAPNGSWIWPMTGGLPYVMSSGTSTALTALLSGATITDGSTWYATDTLQGVADAVVVAIGGTSQGVRNYTGGTGSLVSDNQSLFASIDALDLGFVALAATTNGNGAALVGIEDAAGDIVGATVEAGLAELAAAVTLTAGAEAGNAIPITVQGPAHVAQYLAVVYTAAMVPALAAAYTMAETGAGAEVSTTAQPALLFTTDAAGAATLTVTDVSAASTDTLYVEVRPAAAAGGARPGGARIIPITFA